LWPAWRVGLQLAAMPPTSDQPVDLFDWRLGTRTSKPLQLRIPLPLLNAARKAAAREGCSLASLARSALATRLSFSPHESAPRVGEDPGGEE